jgi:dTDP-4-amino-4,6-dideoxygalactose transaminase
MPVHSPVSLRAVAASVAAAIHERAPARAAIAASLCHTYRARSALLTDSGTTALRLALAGTQAVVANRPVALPAYGCFDLATAADGAESSVVLYDLDLRTLGPDDCSLRRALEKEPVAIVAAHLYGHPVDMRRVAELARSADAVVIEDAAQAAGGRLHGDPLGSFGSLTVLSFGRGKGTTAGAGGALLAHDEAGDRVIAWATARLPGPSAGVREAVSLVAQWMLGRPSVYWLPAALPFLRLGETIYREPSAPAALSGAAAGALACALRDGRTELVRRRTNAERLLACARSSRGIRVVEVVEGAEPGYLRLPLRTSEPLEAAQMRALAAFGVAAGYPKPLKELRPFVERVVNDGDALDGARELAATLITLPTHGRLRHSDVVTLEHWLQSSTHD